MTEWEIFLRALTMERQTGMPRWRMGRYSPDLPAEAMDDSPTQVAKRRAVLAEIERDRVAKNRHLRSVA